MNIQHRFSLNCFNYLPPRAALTDVEIFAVIADMHPGIEFESIGLGKRFSLKGFDFPPEEIVRDCRPVLGS